MLVLCPYDEQTKIDIMNNLPETKEEANELLGKLWFDHIPRDPRDQFNKMMSMNTLVKQDYNFSYICNDCGDDFISKSKETLCTQCLSPNIKEQRELKITRKLLIIYDLSHWINTANLIIIYKIYLLLDEVKDRYQTYRAEIESKIRVKRTQKL